MPAADQSTARDGRRALPARQRVDERSQGAVRWRTLRAQLIAERTGRADAVPDDLTAEARLLIEQVCTLSLQYDILTDATKNGEAADPNALSRLAVTAERHLARLDKIRLLREEPPAEAPAPARVETKPAAPEVLPPETGATMEAAFTSQGTVYRVRLDNVPPDLANEAGRRALADELSRQEHLYSRYGHGTDRTSLRVDCREKHGARTVQLVRASLGEGA